MEATIPLNAFTALGQLRAKYCQRVGLSPKPEDLVLQDYYEDAGGKEPRYYQRRAINSVIEAIAKGRNRALLVMATGTGKTYTDFQIIWKLWKAGRKKRILFLADLAVSLENCFDDGGALENRAGNDVSGFFPGGTFLLTFDSNRDALTPSVVSAVVCVLSSRIKPQRQR